MATTTPNFGWPVPTSTDLVKDGAVAIESLGDAVDASLLDLKGGTTGQVLAKATNTDMDFTWITNDVGDITAVTAGTGLTGGGTTGAVSLAFDQSNFGGGQGAAGKNAVINSGFDIAQRGTTFSSIQFGTYTLDRWQGFRASSAFYSVSQQATGDTTNLPFIRYCARVGRPSGNTALDPVLFFQTFETANSIPYAGKTVTISFYARKGANYSSASDALTVDIRTGTGIDQNRLSFTGSSSAFSGSVTLTSTWQRFSVTGAIGATITEFAPQFNYTPVGTAGAADYFEVTGVMLEVASVATPFKTNASTIQGELAACQRYYVRFGGNAAYENFGSAFASSTTQAFCLVNLPVTQRTAASAVEYSTNALYEGVGFTAITAFSINGASTNQVRLQATVASGLTQYRPYELLANNSTSAYIGFSAEL